MKSSAAASQLRRLVVLAGALLLVIASKAAAEASARWRFSINMTESLETWAFLVDLEGRAPLRGEFVAFSPPPNPWFEPRVVMAKQVAGVPGDRVERIGRSVFVAGRYVGEVKPSARNGAPAPAGPVGVIPSGHYFLASPHPDSFDSRYAAVGWVASSRILGVARPIL